MWVKSEIFKTGKEIINDYSLIISFLPVEEDHAQEVANHLRYAE